MRNVSWMSWEKPTVKEDKEDPPFQSMLVMLASLKKERNEAPPRDIPQQCRPNLIFICDFVTAFKLLTPEED
ncbi:hypothetical protein TNCT_771 [Trichonephila clavata]|uniref:Uncharacterized protein n=1 Tax=Trichonephila clavata TaxID=2740835 RepID=A0A8X6KDM8_TRICU|nr:hypothetical protein TNCT_771 [Trichonephila clavata]